MEANEIGITLGKTTDQVIQSTAEFSRLGYELDQAKKLAQEALLYANVGDMEVEEASKKIISSIKAFGVEVGKQGENVRGVVDIFNEIGNNYAISSQGIGEALLRSAASMQSAGNTIEQTVAQVAAANEIK